MDWNTAWQWLQSFSGVISATVIAAAVSYPVWLPNLKEFVLKAIDKRFEKQLQDADHAFQQQLRYVQSAIDRELDRARKLQDREFEALSKGWNIAHEAYWRARDATNRGYQVHNLLQMGAQQLEEFIDGLTFPNWQKQELRDIEDMEDKQKAYVKAWRTSQYSECIRWKQRLLMFADRKGIFIQPEIKQRFDRLHHMIDDALLEFRLRIEDLDIDHNPFNEFIRADRLRDEGKPVYDELENMIRTRLWSPVEKPDGVAA